MVSCKQCGPCVHMIWHISTFVMLVVYERGVCKSGSQSRSCDQFVWEMIPGNICREMGKSEPSSHHTLGGSGGPFRLGSWCFSPPTPAIIAIGAAAIAPSQRKPSESQMLAASRDWAVAGVKLPQHHLLRRFKSGE